VYRSTDAVFEILECVNCRLIRLHPRPEPKDGWRWPAAKRTPIEAEGAGSFTERLRRAYHQFALRGRIHFVERALAESGERGLVLDIGCGEGALLEGMAARGHRNLLGVDAAPEAARAASLCGVPAIGAMLPDAPLRAGSCAVITMFELLERVPDPAACLRAAHTLLAPNGRLVVQTPNAGSWQFLLFGENWSGLGVPGRLVHFRRKDVEKLLGRCGFETVRVRHFSLGDDPTGMARSIAPGFDPAVRQARGVKETPRMRVWKDVVFMALAAACVPFTVLEAACNAGSTVMIEARKKSE
jgi:SAM-dependent methyltransferase